MSDLIDPCNCENYQCADAYWHDGDPEVVYHCEDCGGEIYDGDDYYDCDGTPRCSDCAREWLETFSATARIGGDEI